MAIYHIETVAIENGTTVPIRVQYPGIVTYVATNDIGRSVDQVRYKGTMLGIDQSTHYLRMQTEDGEILDLNTAQIRMVTQQFDEAEGSIIYFGSGEPSNDIGKIPDTYFDTNNGDVYSYDENGWVYKGNFKGPKGDTGISPSIGENGNWYIGDEDTGVSAQGEPGNDGNSPYIHPVSKNWMVGGTDTGVKAEGSLSTTELDILKNRINSLVASKHTLGTCHWFMATVPHQTPSIAITNDNLNLLSGLTKREGTLKVTDDNMYITLPANRTYYVEANVLINTLDVQMCIVDKSGNHYGNRGYGSAVHYSTSAAHAFITPSEDISVTVDIEFQEKGAVNNRWYPDCSYISIMEVNNPKEIDVAEWLVHEHGAEDGPVGQVISYMGNDVPANYLACDGSVYLIDDYPELAAHFVSSFGCAEHFGGDGLTTFAVPDLRGEFLRGTGNSTKERGGAGLAVGEHQAPTQHLHIGTWNSGSAHNVDVPFYGYGNYDTTANGTGYGVHDRHSTNGNNIAYNYTARPTNTAVSFCIKCKSTPFIQQLNVSGESRVSKEPNNQLSHKPDGLYVPPTEQIAISEDEDNQIEQREDGLYVPPPPEEIKISEDANNGIEMREDGLYAGNTPDALRLRVNMLTASRHTMGEVDFFFARNISNDNRVYAKNHFNFLTKLTDIETNMEMSDDRLWVKLKKNHSYFLQSSLLMNTGNTGAAGKYGFYTLDDTIISPFGYVTAGTTGYSSVPSSGVFTPTDDTFVSVIYDHNSSFELAHQFSYIFIQEINNPKEIDPVDYIMGKDGIEASPVGNIISYMGNTPPKHYLACDGTIYNIADYAQLAEHFMNEFGAVNHFGGDGVDTFAVPDLRGEFLRGNGESGRELGGSGADVGDHQDPTMMPYYYSWAANNTYGVIPVSWEGSTPNYPQNMDLTISKNVNFVDIGGNRTGTRNAGYSYSARPTNTAVLYCIKYESTPFVQIGGSTPITIDPDETNQIEEREGGLYVPPVDIPISENKNNGIVLKDDGLYAENTPDALRLRVNQLNASKHTMGDVDFFFATNQTNGQQISISNEYNVLNSLTEIETNMEMTEDRLFVKLRKDHTYLLQASILINTNGSTAYTFCTIDNHNLGAKGHANGGTSWGSSFAGDVYTPSEDTYINLKVMPITGSTHKVCTDFSYILIQEINNPKEIDPVEHVMDEEGIDPTPIGQIISYMGTTPPKHYLACDGAVYNVADYPQLSIHIENEFGAVNYFGGDGIDTFAVPDLRGEFLRGTGTADRNTGSGGNVGEHQDATRIPFVGFDKDNNLFKRGDPKTVIEPASTDQDFKFGSTGTNFMFSRSGSWDGSNGNIAYAARPTNTAVLYCIKYENTPFVHTGVVNQGDQNIYTDEEITDAVMEVFFPTSDGGG